MYNKLIRNHKPRTEGGGGWGRVDLGNFFDSHAKLNKIVQTTIIR